MLNVRNVGYVGDAAAGGPRSHMPPRASTGIARAARAAAVLGPLRTVGKQEKYEDAVAIVSILPRTLE